MPAEPAHPRARQRVERADEEGVERHAFPAAVQAGFDREAFLNDAEVAEAVEERKEFGDMRSYIRELVMSEYRAQQAQMRPVSFSE